MTESSLTDRLLARIRDGLELTKAEQIALVIRLSLPAILAQFSVIAMQYIDASMVGHLGAGESAAIGLVSTSLWLCWGLTGATITGFSVQVAHRIGAKENFEARAIMRQSFTVVLGMTFVVALVGFLISGRLPAWLGGDPAVHADASLYYMIGALSMPIVIMSWLAGSMLRVSGNIHTPSVLNIVMCFLDVVFNFLLIFPTRDISLFGFAFSMPGAGMGVAGAALGTVLAEAVIAVIMFRKLVIDSPILRLTHERGSFMPTAATLRKAFNISLPVGCERVLMCGAHIATTLIVAPLGVFSLAAHSLAITAESLCYMPGYGIGEAATTLVGQGIGAKRMELTRRLGRLCIILGIGVMSISAVVLYIFAPALMHSMTDVPEVIELGAQILRIEAFAEPMYAASIVAYGVFVGAGDTRLPSIMNLVSMWVVRLSLAVVLAGFWGLQGVWIAMSFELTLRGIIFLIRFKWGRWMQGNKGLS